MSLPYRGQPLAEQESKLLLAVALGMGCLLVLCLAASLAAVGLAILWTLEGKLGPGTQVPPARLFLGWTQIGRLLDGSTSVAGLHFSLPRTIAALIPLWPAP